MCNSTIGFGSIKSYTIAFCNMRLVNFCKTANHRPCCLPLIAAACCGGKFEIRYRYGETLAIYKTMAELGNEEYFSAEGVLRLKEENEALQSNLELAGELGKSLLENNQELERKLEEINSEHISSLEKIEVVMLK